jgi:CTP synthase (UTP-ammonia lyase)
MRLQVGLVGDYSPEIMAHRAVPEALEIARLETGNEVAATWVGTETVGEGEGRLSPFDAVRCVPGSPCASMDGALSAIRFAREQGLPFLGTCGGFQHALIEYVRNVLGHEGADHAESNPDAEMPLVAPLSCSLVEARGTIRLEEGSRVRSIYGRAEVDEQYHCNYGFNRSYRPLLESGGMRVTGVDADGGPRVVELARHPFFIAALFQPERSALSDAAHPLISAYVRAGVSQRRREPGSEY